MTTNRLIGPFVSRLAVSAGRPFSALVGLTVFIAAGTASAQVGSAIALPIDKPAAESDGHHISIVWGEPCSACVSTPRLQRAYEAAQAALLNEKPGARAALRPRIVRVISFEPASGYTERKATLEAIHDRLKGCTVMPGALLKRPYNTDMDSFGIGADCPGQEMRMFMSMSFRHEKLETVYLMPDRPYFVQPM